MSSEPNVLISWSGRLSHAIALKLRDWLPLVVGSAVPWLSSEDISKGAGWSVELTGAISRCKSSIVVLTQSNKNAPWILFEAGAIFRALPNTRVFTLLCDLTHSDISGPLTQFQATEFHKSDVLKLCRSIAAAMPDGIVDIRLERHFESYWTELEASMKAAVAENPSSVPTPPSHRVEQDTLNELLATTRAIHRSQSELTARMAKLEKSEASAANAEMTGLAVAQQELTRAQQQFDFIAGHPSVSPGEFNAIEHELKEIRTRYANEHLAKTYVGRFRVGELIVEYRVVPIGDNEVRVDLGRMRRSSKSEIPMPDIPARTPES